MVHDDFTLTAHTVGTIMGFPSVYTVQRPAEHTSHLLMCLHGVVRQGGSKYRKGNQAAKPAMKACALCPMSKQHLVNTLPKHPREPPADLIKETAVKSPMLWCYLQFSCNKHY